MIYKIALVDKICSACDNKTCLLNQELIDGQTHPELVIRTAPNGTQFIDFSWVNGNICKFKKTAVRNKFENELKKSGLTKKQTAMTFENYKCSDINDKRALMTAGKAAAEGLNLILSGKAGTGKTHSKKDKGCKELLENIQKLLKQADVVVHAGDCD